MYTKDTSKVSRKVSGEQGYGTEVPEDKRILEFDKANLEVSNVYPELPAAIFPPKHLVVFLHGLGSDGNDLIALGPLMQDRLKDCHFISPHGIEPFDMAPFGRQWFSLASRDPVVVLDLIMQNSADILQIIKQKQTMLNLSNKDTIIVGFSQGTMIGLYLALADIRSKDEPFKGVVGFSGMLIPFKQCINTKTPICLIHGADDEIVVISEMYNALKYLDDNNIIHRHLKIPNLKHSINSQGVVFAVQFIESIINSQLYE